MIVCWPFKQLKRKVKATLIVSLRLHISIARPDKSFRWQAGQVRAGILILTSVKNQELEDALLTGLAAS